MKGSVCLSFSSEVMDWINVLDREVNQTGK